MANRITAPQFGLSLEWLDAEARMIDWSYLREDGDEYELILPEPTYGDWQYHDHGDAPAAVKNAGPRKRAQPLPDELLEEWQGTESYYEWRDGFEPMMNYVWPVSPAYRAPDIQTIARLVEEFGGCCTLIKFSDEACERLGWEGSDAPDYGIALSGGGMDLSDHIAAAYLACGCVPPNRILASLSNAMPRDMAKRMPLRQAYRQAADHYRNRAAKISDEARRLFKRA